MKEQLTPQTEIRTRELKGHPYSLRGLSRAGTGTCFIIPECKVAFDTAQGLPFSYSMNHFFITHAHMDHAGGIAYIISQRCLNQLPAGQFYMGEEMMEPFQRILAAWQEMEGFEYKFDLIPVTAESEFSISPREWVRPFSTVHRCPSRGYTLFSKKNKLKKTYQNLPQLEIQNLVRSGVEVQEEIVTPEISFTGDSKIEFLDLAPEVKNSRILVLECSYLDERRGVDEARRWGHIHLQELLPRFSELNCEKIILTHISRRYGYKEAVEIVRQSLTKLEAGLKEKVLVFP